MSKKNKRTKEKRKRRDSVGNLSPQDFTSGIQDCLGRGKAREAIALAKQCIKRFGRSVGETLLSQSYQLRIRQLLKSGLNKEATQLAEIASQSCPFARDKFSLLYIQGMGKTAPLNDIIRIIGQGSKGPRRDEAEKQIALRLDDPLILVQSPHLGGDHPLRREAELASQVWESILSGQYEGDVFESLRGIPRRSPLRYWKLFLRGVGAFYRRDDALSLENLRRIPPSCCLAPAAAVLFSIMKPESDKGPDVPWTHQMQRMARVIAGEEFYLKKDLAMVDKALKNRKYKDAIQYFNVIASRLGRFKEYLLNDLRITFFHNTYPTFMFQAKILFNLGVASRPEAVRLSAIAISAIEPDVGILAWEDFLEDSDARLSPLEKGLIYHFMAILSSNALMRGYEEDREFWEEEYGGMDDEKAKPPFSLKNKIPAPEELFRKSLEHDPHPETYNAFVQHLEKSNPRYGEEMALEWHQSFPNDPDPLIYLARRTFKRRAYKKSFNWLTKAEQLNPFHTEVRKLKYQAALRSADKNLRNRTFRSARRYVETMMKISRSKQQFSLAKAFLAVSWALEGDREAFDNAAKEVLDSATDPDWAVLSITDLLLRHLSPNESLLWRERLPRLGSTLNVLKAFINHAVFFNEEYSRPNYVEGDLSHILNLINADAPEEILVGISGLMNSSCSLLKNIIWKAQNMGLRRKGRYLPLFLAQRAQWYYLFDNRGLIFSESGYIYRDQRCISSAVFLAKDRRDFEVLNQIHSILANLEILEDVSDLELEDVERTIEEEIQEGESVLPSFKERRYYGITRKKKEAAGKSKKKRKDSRNSQKGIPEQMEIPF